MYSSSVDDVIFYEALRQTVEQVVWPGQCLHGGKVRQSFRIGRYWLMVATDRLSAYDRVWTTIPFKGQVLTQLCYFWFEKLAPLIRHHLVAMPYDNALMVKPLTMIPVEFVVRAYITGKSQTSLWTLYQAGQRSFDEWSLPEGLHQHQQLPQPIITLSTKSHHGDRPLSLATALSDGTFTEQQWQVIKDRILTSFANASEWLSTRGLLLADAKFELGINESGNVVLADEVFTPDACRFWDASSYALQLKQHHAPIGYDKEKFRSYLRQLGDPATLPVDQHIDADQRVTIAKDYVQLYEIITERHFEPSDRLFRAAKPKQMN